MCQRKLPLKVAAVVAQLDLGPAGAFSGACPLVGVKKVGETPPPSWPGRKS